jgi:hypothetical protein
MPLPLLRGQRDEVRRPGGFEIEGGPAGDETDIAGTRSVLRSQLQNQLRRTSTRFRATVGSS